MALLCAAETGVYGLTGTAVAPLVSGGAPDALEEAKLTPKFDGSASEVVSEPVGTPSAFVVSPLGTVDSIIHLNRFAPLPLGAKVGNSWFRPLT